jgi:hypothetical protein
LGPGEARAVAALCFGVVLEGLLVELVLAVIAAYNGQRNATDGLAGSIAILVVGGLGADVGGLRGA